MIKRHHHGISANLNDSTSESHTDELLISHSDTVTASWDADSQLCKVKSALSF